MSFRGTPGHTAEDRGAQLRPDGDDAELRRRLNGIGCRIMGVRATGVTAPRRR